jgi:ATP-dependent protease ClpP protease subunit
MNLFKIFNFAPMPSGAAERVKISGSTVDLFGDIDAWWGVNLNWFKAQLDSMGGKPVTVRIHSAGGNVFEGIAIANVLRQYSGAVTTINNGLTASAATLPFLAGDKRYIAPAAMTMIHEASAWTNGGSDDMRKMADMLDMINDELAGAYAATSGVKETRSDFRELMKQETWLTADQAIALGFAHGTFDNTITNTKNMEKIQNSVLDALIARVTNQAEPPEAEATTETVDTTAFANQVAETVAAAMKAKLDALEARATDLANQVAELQARKVTPKAATTTTLNPIASFAEEVGELFTAKISEQ